MLGKWITYWHGSGDANQHLFYRCLACRGIVTWKAIQQGGCSCGHSKVSPTNPSFLEELRIIFAPWTV